MTTDETMDGSTPQRRQVPADLARHPPLWDDSVSIREVGPREGFQSHDVVVPTAVKVDVISRLLAAGFRKLNAVSMVSQSRMPQVADAESVLEGLGARDGVVISALTPTERGLRRAVEASRRGLVHEVLFVHAMTDAVLHANGIRSDRTAWRIEVLRLAAIANDAGLRVTVFLSAAFGCSIEGPVDQHDVLAEAELLAESPHVDEIAISDSTGQAAPPGVYEMFSAYRSRLSGMPVTAHFHDSRGAGIANVLTLLQIGVPNLTVDASFGGLGGDVPFLPDAAGNVSSEDLVRVCETARITTGIDLDALLEASTVARSAYAGQRTFGSRVLALKDVARR